MSKIDDKYINALGQFTDALEQIVDTLKSQQKSGKSDTVNEFLKTPMNNLVTVVADLKKVTQEGFKDVKTDNQKILSKIESIRKQKEAGMFDSIEDPKNKTKIVDGIKVVILIAAGVLALGVAFKIVGKVDFLSVIALSTAMYIISNTFSKIAAIKDLTFAQIFKIASLMPMMALGLATSAYFLKNFPVFRPAQALSMLLIGGGLGIAAFFLLKAMSKIEFKSLIFIPLLPLILPIIAWSIVKASSILTGIVPLSFSQVVATALVGVAIGISMLAISIALKNMKNVTWKELLMLPLAIPLIAWGVVTASNIFQNMTPLKDPWGVIKSSLTIGLAILAFAPAVYILGKMKLADLLLGMLAIVPMAYIITKVSTQFQDFVPLKNPLDVMFSSFAMGLSLILFAPTAYFIGKMSMTEILKGIVSIPLIALAIVGTAYIFKLLPDQMRYPDLMWTLGAGLSVLSFGAMAVGLGLLFTATGGLAALGMAGALLAILAVAGTIVATSYILGKGDYSKYPPLSWALGVGASLLAFSISTVAAAVAGVASLLGSFFTGGTNPLVKIAETMVDVAIVLNKYNWNTSKHPTLEWATGVGATLLAFSALTVGASVVGLVGAIASLFTGNSDPLVKLSESMVSIAKTLNGFQWNNAKFPTKDYIENVGSFLLVMSEVYAKVNSSGFLDSIFSGNKSLKEFSDDASTSLASTSKILATGSYTNIPNKEYVTQFSFFMLTISDMVEKSELDSKNSSEFLSATNLITPAISKWIQTISTGDFKQSPSKAYVENFRNYIVNLDDIISNWDSSVEQSDIFNKSISSIISSVQLLSNIKTGTPNDFKEFLSQLKLLHDAPELDTKANSISKLAMSFSTLADSLSKVNSNLHGFGTLSKNLPLINIDDTKLLKTVDKYKATLNVVNDTQDGQTNLLTSLKSFFDSAPKKVEAISKEEAKNKESKNDELQNQKQFYSDISDIRNILFEFRDFIDKPTQNGSFHK